VTLRCLFARSMVSALASRSVSSAFFARSAVTPASSTQLTPIVFAISRNVQRLPKQILGDYRQLQELGAQVRRGEKGTAITFFKPLFLNKLKKRRGMGRRRLSNTGPNYLANASRSARLLRTRC